MTDQPGTTSASDDETTEVAPGPTAEQIEDWKKAVEQVREQHPDWSDEQIGGAIAYAVMTPEVQAEIARIAEENQIAVANWTAAIREIQARWPEWSEQECNDNFIAFLKGYVAEHPEG